MKKQFLTFVLVSALATSMVFANGAKENESSGLAGNTANQKTMSDENGEYTLPISTSAVEYTIFDNFNNIVFDPTWEVWTELSNRTNVSLKSVISQSNSNEQECWIPVGVEVYEYLKDFFVESVSSKKIFVIYY
jgi:hypothetical protein